MRYIEFKDIKGMIITEIKINDDKDEIYFTMNNGDQYKMYHEQNCCENVTIEDICGDLDDLIGNPLLVAEESTNGSRDDDNDYSYTWTFYKLDTIKGGVTIRWYGESNGYYSESVDFAKLINGQWRYYEQ